MRVRKYGENTEKCSIVKKRNKLVIFKYNTLQ